jgi:peptide chain release factor subunit 3
MADNGWNVNAPEFVPNPNARAFVPGASWTTPPTFAAAAVSGPNMNRAHIDASGALSMDKLNLNSELAVADSWDEATPDDNLRFYDRAASSAGVMPAGLDADRGDEVLADVPIDPTPNGFVSPIPVENDKPVVGGLQDVDAAEVAEDKETDAEESEEGGSGSAQPAVKKKLPVEKKERKEFVNVIFIGHVDAGKSTIGGQIMFQTGMVDKRTLEKYEREAKEKNRESWYLSWALDTNLEEREKGKTVEVGRAFFETARKHFTILDAPGHKSFVPNMIGGASQADLAVLVISARRGEFETGFERGGQTREHAMLVKTAGVRQLVVLVNKMDDPTVLWAEDRYNECKDKLIPYLKKVGFNPRTDVTFIPCSGLTGAFIKDPVPDACSWYSGPTFIQFIDDLPPISRARDGPVRIPLVDKYNDMGTVVLGKVESGTVNKGQTLTLMPNKVQIQVLQLWSDDEETDEIGPGENVKLKLKGVEESDILSGFVLCSNDNLCKSGRVFDAQVVIVEHKSIICPGYSCVLHIHNAVEEIVVKAIGCLIDRKTNEKLKGTVRFVKQDQVAILRFESSELFCLEPFKAFPQMGRFTLRDEGRTIAIGKVLKVFE